MRRTNHETAKGNLDRIDHPETIYGRRGCRHFSLAMMLILFCAKISFGQASPTAERQLNVQIGAALSLGSPGISQDVSVRYGGWKCQGATVYANLDPHPRLGVEVEGRRISSREISESTFLVGTRYHKPYGPYMPYGKVLVGRSQFGFPKQLGKPSFSALAVGGGLDYLVNSTLRIRFDYEWQHWIGFKDAVRGFPGSLNPQVVSVGFAYHIK